ncbi:MAG: ABC transporter permease [Chloroflexota bacterium]
MAIATDIKTARPTPGIPKWLPVEGTRRFFSNRNNMLALLLLGPLVAIALAAPWLPLPDPLQPNLAERFHSPAPDHPFGTDKMGRDIFSRSLSALKLSLAVGLAAAGIALAVGIVIGTMAGFMGSVVDRAVSTVVDVLLSFPTLLMVIGLVAVFGAGVPQIIAAIAIADSPRAIRLQRALALGLKSRTYMDAARLASAPTWWMLLRHVLPNTIAPMIVVATMYASNAIQAEAALSFLGLGIVPPEPSLGNLADEGRQYLQEAWWISTIPGLLIGVLALGLHFLSDGIREHLDPRMRH